DSAIWRAAIATRSVAVVALLASVEKRISAARPQVDPPHALIAAVHDEQALLSVKYKIPWSVEAGEGPGAPIAMRSRQGPPLASDGSDPTSRSVDAPDAVSTELRNENVSRIIDRQPDRQVEPRGSGRYVVVRVQRGRVSRDRGHHPAVRIGASDATAPFR